MKILNISCSDWANFAYTNSLALRSVGINCDSVAQNAHPFYTEQSEIVPSIHDIAMRMQKYDAIQFFHDNVTLFNQLKPYFGRKRVVVYHTSSYYRKNNALVNSVMQGAKHVCAMPEFMSLCPGAIYMVGSVDTEKIQPKYKDDNGPVWFGHQPSNPEVKGTKNIMAIINECPVNSITNGDGVPLLYEKQLSDIAMCDVYIEMCTDKDGLGSEYGNFGITALEAAALGKIVITQCKNLSTYTETYGPLPFQLITGPESLKKAVEYWNGYNGDHVKGEQMATREWVVSKHGLESSGKFMIERILCQN